MNNITYLIYFPCVVTFLLYAWDKHQAHYGYRCLPEAVLLLFTALMGAFGALCGMIFFNHKTDRRLFLVAVPVLLVLQLTAVILLKLYA